MVTKDDHIQFKQHGLINKVLEATGMTECNHKKTPASRTPLGTDANGAPFQESWKYSSIIGMLMYLAANAHPEIQFAVHQCARFTHCPKQSHANAIKRICHYLKWVIHEKGGLTFKKEAGYQLDCFVDADYAGLWSFEHDQDPVSVKSRTGYVITLAGCPVHWVSKLQTCIANSTLEAEYIAMAQAMRELVPMRRLLQEIVSVTDPENSSHNTLFKSTLFEDNNGAISTATAPNLTPRTKHIAVRYHYTRSQIELDEKKPGIHIEKVSTEFQLADILTKGLDQETFEHLRKLLCNW